MVELLRPGVRVIERFEVPNTIRGVGVSTGAMIGATKKGPIQSPRLLGSFEDFIRIYGGYFKGEFIPHAVRGFFDNGGTRMFMGRVVGSGNSIASLTLGDMGLAPTPGEAVSTNAAPFDILTEIASATLSIKVDGGGAAVATFTAGKATVSAANAETYDFSGVGNEQLDIKVNGGPTQSVFFPDSAFADPANATALEIAAVINAGVTGIQADDTGNITIRTDQLGSGASVEVTGGTANAILGFPTSVNNGTGNVANASSVTAAEIKTIVELAVSGLTVSGSAIITITSDTGGAASSIEVEAVSTLDTIFGFDNIVHFGSASASVNTLKLDAANPGDWGNAVSTTTQKAASTLTVALTPGSKTTMTLASVQGFETGDLIELDTGVTSEFVYVTNINNTTNVVTFTQQTIIATFPIGSTVETSTTHSDNTLTTTVLNTGGTSVTLGSARNARIGSIYIIGGVIERVTVTVSSVSGNTIFFDAVTLIGSIAIGSRIASQGFTLLVLDEDVVVETHENLTMEETDERNFVEVRLNGRGNQSDFVIATDLDSATVDKALQIPRASVGVFMTGGLDGAVPTDNQFIGSQAPGAKTGIFLFDDVDEINIISTPGVTTVAVQFNGTNYCETIRGDCMYVMETPESVKTVEDAQDYRENTLNLDSSFAALYWPWLTVNDPTQDNVLVDVPPSGHVQGIYSGVAADRGVHKAPANEVVRGALGLSTDGENINFDAAQDILNPIGVNVIRPFVGRGIRVYGARTLFSIKDGRHFVSGRRSLNFIKESIEEGLQFLVFEPLDVDLQTRAEISIKAFLTDVWRDGILRPADNKAKAFFVDCGPGVNPETQIQQGIFNCKVGVNLTPPAEHVVITVSNFDGGLLVNEVS